jgi:transcriptional repressor NrdR
MKCHQCEFGDTKVIESRDVGDGESVRRRRVCSKCQYRFTTYERIERPQLIVIKNSGARELFSRDKLLAGLYRACEKTSLTSVAIDTIVASIENQIYACGDQEISSSKIGDLVMQELAARDEVAYVRFASVYRRFQDIAGFEKELLKIRQRKIEQSSQKV